MLSSLVACTDRDANSKADPRAPNLIIIYLDDAGFADIGATGAPYPTPHLDRMAAEGVLLTSFHVSQPVCSASRAALLTGTYSNRIGITGALAPTARHGLAADEVTLAELARANGYATAIFGKWHLGDEPAYLPTEHGFDEFSGLPYSHDMWPVRSEDYPPLPFYEGTTQVIVDVQPADQETFTRRFTERATSFIQRHKDEPFFLYVPHPQPHVPLFASPEFAGASGMGPYADVMMEIDWSVGQLLAAVDDAGLHGDTWVIFTSDNGPWLSYGRHAGNAGPFREGKHTVFEGGVRVPTLMRYPDKLPAGAVIGSNLMTIDILPTFAGLLGAELPDHVLDGKDVWPLIAGEPSASSPHEAYYLWNGEVLEAVLQDQWKLHLPHGYLTVVAPGTDGQAGELAAAELPLSLFDLSRDPGERVNVAEQHPEVVNALVGLAERHERELVDNRRGNPQ